MNRFYLRKMWISKVSKFSILALIQKSKTPKIGNFPKAKVKLIETALFEEVGISKVFGLYWNRILAELSESVLLGEAANFRFRVVDFRPYTEIENSENSENFPRLVKLSKIALVWGSWDFRRFQVLILTAVLKKWTRKTRKFWWT